MGYVRCTTLAVRSYAVINVLCIPVMFQCRFPLGLMGTVAAFGAFVNHTFGCRLKTTFV